MVYIVRSKRRNDVDVVEKPLTIGEFLEANKNIQDRLTGRVPDFRAEEKKFVAAVLLAWKLHSAIEDGDDEAIESLIASPEFNALTLKKLWRWGKSVEEYEEDIKRFSKGLSKAVAARRIFSDDEANEIRKSYEAKRKSNISATEDSLFKEVISETKTRCGKSASVSTIRRICIN